MRHICFLICATSIIICIASSWANTTTPNMNMSLPVPGVSPGPQYATDLITALNVIDAHDHSAGKGVQVTPAGLNINQDLNFLGNSGSSVNSIKFDTTHALNSTAIRWYTGTAAATGSSVIGAPVFNDNNGTSYTPPLIIAPTTYAAGALPYASSGGTFGTLPIGTSGQVLKVLNGLPSWGSTSTSFSVAIKSANYNIQSSDDVIIIQGTASGITLTLPLANNNVGKLYKIEKNESGFTAHTIGVSGGDLIELGNNTVVSTTLNTIGEEIELVSRGGGQWQVLNRRIPSFWTTYTAFYAGFTTGSAGGGGNINPVAAWRRVGESINIRAASTIATTSSNEQTITLPPSLTLNNSGAASFGSLNNTYGLLRHGATGAVIDIAGAVPCILTFDGSSTAALLITKGMGASSGTQIYSAGTGGVCLSTGSGDWAFSMDATIPISGWNGE